MTIKEFKKNAVLVKKYNSNNAWGFGGAYGKEYYHKTKDGNYIVLFDGQASSRRLPDIKLVKIKLYDNNMSCTNSNVVEGRYLVEKYLKKI